VIKVGQAFFCPAQYHDLAVGQHGGVEHASMARHGLDLPLAESVSAGSCAAADIEADAKREVGAGLVEGCLVATAKHHEVQGGIVVGVDDGLPQQDLAAG
jgi:hypothetical protein